MRPGAVDYIAQHATPSDPVVSWASLAVAMRVDEADMEQRRAVAMAWSAAYRQFAKSRAPLDVWLVRTIPASRKHPQMLAEWIALDYDIQVLDPATPRAWHGHVTTCTGSWCASGTPSTCRKRR